MNLELFPAVPEPEERAHTCHAVGCGVEVPPELLMCKAHWRMVPGPIQRSVWRAFNPLQCEDVPNRPAPSGDWMVAATRAINHVALAEGKLSPETAQRRLQQAFEYKAHLEERDKPRPSAPPPKRGKVRRGKMIKPGRPVNRTRGEEG